MPYFCDLSSLTVLQLSFAFNPYQIDGFYTFWLCIGDKASAPDPNSQHRGRYCSVTRSQNKVIKMAPSPNVCSILHKKSTDQLLKWAKRKPFQILSTPPQQNDKFVSFRILSLNFSQCTQNWMENKNPVSGNMNQKCWVFRWGILTFFDVDLMCVFAYTLCICVWSTCTCLKIHQIWSWNQFRS